MAPTFPTVAWEQAQMTFLPAGVPPPEDASQPAVLVFALSAHRFVVAHIAGRGWCIPGGRLEPGETPEQAAHREAQEEAGVTLGPLRLLGHFLRTEPNGDRIAVPAYVADVMQFAGLPPVTESQGVCMMTLEDLRDRYYRWNPLLQAVFTYALHLTRR